MLVNNGCVNIKCCQSAVNIIISSIENVQFIRLLTVIQCLNCFYYWFQKTRTTGNAALSNL